MKPQRRSSSLIHAFVEQSQNIENDNAAKALAMVDDKIKARRQERAKAHPEIKESQKSKDVVAENLKKAEKFKNMDEHKIEIEQLYARLNTNPQTGLTSEQAIELSKKWGDNALTEKKKTPWYVKLIKEYFTVFALMLWFGGILCFLAYGLAPEDPSNLYLGIVLVAVILISGTASFIQNFKSEAIMDTFKNFIPPKCKVIRDGTLQTLNAVKLVPGDIIELKEGDKIPADFRVISCNEMRVDNSSLTGESEPLLRSPECTNPGNPLETKNLCFFGTLCKQGAAKGVILSTGDNTVIGQIANLTSNAGHNETPLQIEMDRFIIVLAIIATLLGVIFFCLGFILGYPALTNLLFGIGIITGNCPEGLLITITVSLTLCAKSLATKAVLAKNLSSVETLGSTKTICSDKTGTLTQNRMTIENVWYNGKSFRALNKQKMERERDRFAGIELEYDINSEGFKCLQECAVLSSEATFDTALPQEKQEYIASITDPDKKRQEQAKIESEWRHKLENMLWLEKPTIGDASETGIIKFFQAIEDIQQTRAKYPIGKVNDVETRVAFNSTNKFALSIVKYPKPGSHYCLLMKGAPERIWKYCTHILINGVAEPIDQKWKKAFEVINEKYGKGGQRVLGFAKIHLSASTFPLDYPFNTAVAARYPDYREWNFSLNGMTFAGLMSLIDPPRDAVPYSIIKCKTAGIKVIMVTGDQPVTAAAIAKQVNILDSHSKTNLDLMEEYSISNQEAIMRADSIVIHGDLITEATNEDDTLPEKEKGKRLAYWLSKKQIVFARTSPAQKLIIVKGCQARNEIVAVTGDGVNDSPAIKKADIGIAMGITGSDVAKDAADMILLTDDFSALVLGIEEGRKLFDNLKKSICYTLTSNIPEIIPFLLLIILQIPLSVTTVLLLCIDLGTDMLPAISFAYEDAELDIMIRRPREKHEQLISRKMLTFAYAQIGIVQTLGAYVTYFMVMENFGFELTNLVGLGLKEGYPQGDSDIFNPYDPYFGNSVLKGKCDVNSKGDLGQKGMLDWIFSADVYKDMRLAFVKCARDSNGNLTGGLAFDYDFGRCKVPEISGYTGKPICFTIEACKSAQTSYLFSIVMTQIGNAIVNKTRRMSSYYQGMRNFFMLFGFAAEIIFCLLLSYVKGLNTVLGTRPLDFLHFGVPALPFSLFLMIYDEIRKYFFIISMKGVPPGGKPGWWVRNYQW